MKISMFCFVLAIMLSYSQKRVIFVSNNALKKKPLMLQGWNSKRTISLIFSPLFKTTCMFSWRCCLELDKAQAVIANVFCTALFMYINFNLFFTDFFLSFVDTYIS